MEYLKKGRPQEEAVTQQIRDTVSEILSAVQKEGIAAVRRYSERLDDWNPESFVVSEEEIRRAKESVDDELKDHIRFAQEQVENFARLQKETLVDFEKETLPGVVLGQKQIPVNAVGSYTPSGMYPMFGSSIMTVAVAKVAGVKRVVAIAAQGARRQTVRRLRTDALHDGQLRGRPDTVRRWGAGPSCGFVRHGGGGAGRHDRRRR